MIIDEAFFELEDQAKEVIQKIVTSATARRYQEKKEAVYRSEETRTRQKNFLEAKDAFERVAAYGKYAPDFSEKKRALWRAKRQLDLDEQVAAYRIEETALQALLDQTGKAIAETVSSEIKVAAGNPFFEARKQSSCGGNCHAS